METYCTNKKNKDANLKFKKSLGSFSLIQSSAMLICFAMLLSFAASLSGCKKSSDKKPECKIISAIASSAVVFNFSYNSNGKLSRIISGSNFTTLEYPTANSIIATTFDSGSFQSKKIIDVNAAGLATNVRIETSTSGQQFTNDAFEYTGNELTKQTSISSVDPAPKVTSYTWVNGNLDNITSGGSIVDSREYFTDKPRQDGDFFTFLQLIQGFEIIRTKNLVKSTTQNGLTFQYEFAPGGNISSVKASFTSGVSNFVDYQYECK